MKTLVLDSWGIMEWIAGRLPGDAVARLLDEAEAGAAWLLMSAINVGEVYYFLRKNQSEALALHWREAVGTLPVTIEVPTQEDIWNAATLKGRFPISYADAFAAALAQKYKCPVVTGDHEFRSVKDLLLEWIGAGNPA